MRHLILTCILFAGIVIGNAQNFQTDFRLANEKMRDTKQFYAEMKTELFLSEEGGTPIESFDSFIKKDGKQYHYKTRETEFLMNEKFTIIVLHDAKMIVLKNGPDKEAESINELMNVNLDSLLNTYENVRYIGLENGAHRYQFFEDNGPVKTVDISIDAEDYWLAKASYTYNKKYWSGESGRVDIMFSKMTNNPSFDDTQFSEKQFIRTNNETFALNPTFKDYQLINQQDDE